MIIMGELNKTSEWIRKTNENKAIEALYESKLANKESVAEFNVIERPRTKNTLVPRHNVDKQDETMYNFIIETTAMFKKLTEKIIELEDKIHDLEE